MESRSTAIYDFFFSPRGPITKRRQTHLFNQRRELLTTILRACLPPNTDWRNTVFNQETARIVRNRIEQELENDDTFAEDLAPAVGRLAQLERDPGTQFAAGISRDEVLADLDDPTASSLWIVQAHSGNTMRAWSRLFGEALYERRREQGRTGPLVSFVFDEADEFIPNAASREHPSYGDSRQLVEMLARRGRKFGLGVGIATQRSRQLDASIMSQPHTYLVSKLPRRGDREVVAEAFGTSEEMFRQTFRFLPGDWLIMSHDATGLRSVPVPIHVDDATQRIVVELTDEDSEAVDSGPSGALTEDLPDDYWANLEPPPEDDLELGQEWDQEPEDFPF